MASCFNRCRIADFRSSGCVWEKLFAGLASPVGFVSIFCAAGIFLFYLFKIMTCSRNCLGVGVAAVILADISADTVCSAGGLCRHGAFVSMSKWIGIGCPTANCASLSACASCRSTPIMFLAWIRYISTTFWARNVFPMISTIFIFISTGCTYPFTTSFAKGLPSICRCWQHH